MKSRLAFLVSLLVLALPRANADCTSQPWTFANSMVTTTCGSVGIATTAAPRGGYSDLLVGSGGDIPQIELYSAAASAALVYNGAAFSLYVNGPSFLEALNVDSAGNVGVRTVPSDRLHLGNAGPGGITIDTAGPMKGRLVTAVNDWVGMTLNARFNGTGWLLDDTTRDGWFVKFDGRTGNNKFGVWRIPSGAGEHHNETELLALDATGKLTANNISAHYQDVAEWVPAAESMAPGTVVVIDRAARNGVKPSAQAYDTGVAGVVSAQPGLVLGEPGAAKERIATTGRVKVRVDAARGAIHAGDLLVTSDIPGVAMLSEMVDAGGVKLHRPGTLIGKALEPLESGQGEILVLLSLQ
jgi:hypothetical protein